MKETISALTEALDVLSKVQLLQKNKKDAHKVKPLLLQLEHIIKDSKLNFKMVLQKDFWDVMSEMGADAPASSPFLPKTVLNQQPSEGGAAAGAKSYNSASGQIVGVLGGMKDEFEKDLATAEKEEATALESFQKLEAAKQSEISAATAQKKSKESLLADTTRKKAEAEEDLETTKAALSSDQQFLVDMTANCKEQDQAYAARTKVRNQELLALSETLKILTADSARDTFGKTMDFLQINQENSGVQTLAAAQKKAVRAAFAKILKIARKNGNWMLASLAVRTNLDAFEKVKEAMDKMLAELQQQQKEEYDKKEFCDKEIDETEDSIKVKTQEQEDLNEKKLGLTNSIETLSSDIETLNKEVKEMEVALKQAGETRKEENLVFQQAISDQRATVQILNKALDRLKEFYEEKPAALVQNSVEPPPPKPQGYEKSGGAGGVLQLIQKIITEAEQGEIELKSDEDHAQKEYVTYVRDTTANIEADRAAVVEKTKLLETATSEKSDTEASLLLVDEQLSKLGQMLKATHGQCDFVLKYFKIRQEARQEEIDSIKQAKAILSGAMS
eukprot:gnl/TRDRNA2_/TRDRNA2_170593_c2_seq11.p1 gnl/TRDRNA2_/TRDRNA2_170593_c2~~gnl/TRDRNA2_/TRDRNA2_170593_c2_seq11.p1  ORF type:complete len:561 (-),score=209.80 gnl/TRDRNA2_/TRDRNA2_170593_c2_seq11:142-1824(-)